MPYHLELGIFHISTGMMTRASLILPTRWVRTLANAQHNWKQILANFRICVLLPDLRDTDKPDIDIQISLLRKIPREDIHIFQYTIPLQLPCAKKRGHCS